MLLAAGLVQAQTGYTSVTGTIAGYAGGSVVANWINNSTAPIPPNLNGASFPYQAAGNMDASGNFALRLADTAVVQPSGSTWNITACAKGGSQPLCYTASIVVTGTTQSVTSYFTAAPLPGITTPGAITAGSLTTTGRMTSASATVTGLNTAGCATNTSAGVIGTQPCPLTGEHVVTFSATPVFAVGFLSNLITITANVTSSTLAAGAAGAPMTVTVCQDATGSWTFAWPANVRGGMTIGSTLSTCSSQHFVYSVSQTAWLADSPGVASE